MLQNSHRLAYRRAACPESLRKLFLEQAVIRAQIAGRDRSPDCPRNVLDECRAASAPHRRPKQRRCAARSARPPLLLDLIANLGLPLGAVQTMATRTWPRSYYGGSVMGVRVIVRPDEIGIGMFGYGFMATAHAEAIQAVSREARLRLLAVCGPRREAAETFASRYGLPLACTEPELLLSYPGIDAIIIAASDDAHRDLAVASIRAGKHILCEKPLATTSAQAREIVAAAQAASVRGMTGFLLRSSPAIQALAAEVARGTLGTVLAIHAQRYDAESLEPTAAMSWRYDSGRSGSGVLGDLGSHMIDLALMFGGPVTEVCADMRTFVAALPGDGSGQMYPHLLDDDTILTLRFSSHAHGSIALSRVGLIDAQQPLGRSAIQVMGTQAAVATDGIEHGVLFRLG